MLKTIPVGGQISLADNTLFIAGSSTLYAYQLYSYPPLSVAVPANETEGVGTATGTVSIPAALGSDLTISLTSSDPTRLTVPGSVTISAGQTSVSIPITIIDDGLLDGPEAVTVDRRGRELPQWHGRRQPCTTTTRRR